MPSYDKTISPHAPAVEKGWLLNLKGYSLKFVAFIKTWFLGKDMHLKPGL